MDIPVYIINWNRVTFTKQLVNWLIKAGTKRITILDNASTYQPTLDYYKELPEGVELIVNDNNDGYLAFWTRGMDKIQSGPYVITDSDCIPADHCPLDLVDHLYKLLIEHPDVPKIGAGIRLDNLPDSPWKEGVVAGQRKYWSDVISPELFSAPVDTTFAIWRGGFVDPDWGAAFRTNTPYLIEHRSWYVWPLDDEERQYLKGRGLEQWL
jgi:glycosyl transferase family 2